MCKAEGRMAFGAIHVTDVAWLRGDGNPAGDRRPGDLRARLSVVLAAECVVCAGDLVGGRFGVFAGYLGDGRERAWSEPGVAVGDAAFSDGDVEQLLESPAQFSRWRCGAHR